MGRRTLLLIASILVAALGTALIWLYVQGADTRAQAGEIQVQVYVAGQTAEAGQPASSVQPQPKRLPQSVVAAFGSGVVTDPGQVKGFTRTDVVAGAPLLTSQFSATPTAPAPPVDLDRGQIGMQVTLPDPQRLVGLLQPGSLIRVYAPVGTGRTKGVGVLFNQVRVLTAGPAAPATTTVKGQVPQAIVTLALTNQQAKELVFAQTQAGGSGLWFGLLGSAATSRDDGTVATGITPGGD